MPDLAPVYGLLSLLPFECLQLRFMQQALLALLLLTPLAAMLGVHVVNCRMAFFSDAVGHSAFAGVALGLLLGIDPLLSMPLFGLLVGLTVIGVQRRSRLSADTAIGIVFSAVVALGLAVVSRAGGAARDMQRFLYGDILTISEGEILVLAVLFLLGLIFQFVAYDRLLYIACNPVMARAHGIRVRLWQYLFAGLLSLVVMFAVRGVGVLLVTALLIVPAATARNLARS
ncbi:MAG: metal ABC transporter permease, partial [Desulfovibrionaceae bacterium]|nr:metal ABC transporter permease [Desulfovibrionaceae bacterium]